MSMRRRGSVVMLGVVSVVLAAAWLVSAWRVPEPHVRVSRDGPREAGLVRVVPESLSVEPNHRIEVSPEPGNRAVFLVTSEGRAVMGASVHLGRPRAAVIFPESALATSDASGRMEVDLGGFPATGSLVVACPGYLSVPIAQPQAVLYEVELDRGALLSFECVIETGEPVPDVQIQVARGAVPEVPESGRVLPGADGETMSGAGVSDSRGCVDVGGLMEGQYVIHAGHRHLVQVDGPKVATAAKGGGPEVLRLVFCRPVGLVIEVEGGEVMTNDVMAQGCRLSGRALGLARDYGERFRGAYSDAKRFVAFVGVPGSDPSVRPSAVVTIWSTSGHCVSITRDLAPIDDAFKPEKLDFRTIDADIVPMGNVMVSAAGGESDGGDLLQSVCFRPLQSHSPRIAIPREGGLVALPCGDYVGRSGHPEIQSILPKGVLTAMALTSNPALRVPPGARLE